MLWRREYDILENFTARYCWGKLGRCRTKCEQNEVSHILCPYYEAKCCVNPKYVPVQT
ncbi:LOW QUALITY PROTEIN: beta-defensin 121 [Mustela lutreola]|uniref:LOW QUALITY PROTEIN: beta-defensin 121 n=1 Tax=Mustela lutreola TaxID=9666 RepID=UPI0027971974|nr:LOW QUALITY PROTEIN: beta-defensin 121 [Mustela lutreola]